MHFLCIFRKNYLCLEKAWKMINLCSQSVIPSQQKFSIENKKLCALHVGAKTFASSQ